MKITNITTGPKGIHDKHGELHMIEAGAAADVEIDAKHVNEEWFAHGAKAEKAAADKAPEPTA